MHSISGLLFFVVLSLISAEQQQVDYIRAVSIGGHLVPEPFIQADLWETVTSFCPTAKDIWNICKCTSENSYSSEHVIPLFAEHLRNFVNLTDLKQKVQQTNINAFRYPISFTYFLDSNQDPADYAKYSSCGLTQSALVQSSFRNVLLLAQELNVRVILDLHQVQGCQNGFDNGGHAGVREFFTSENIQKGINIWQNLMQFLEENNLVSLIWGYEILNEPITTSDSDNQLLRTFTETVVNQVILPKISNQQVIVLQPGPGNGLIQNYEQYNLNGGTYVFDFHEYIVFGPLTLTTMGAVLGTVTAFVSQDLGATKWPYFVGEWSHATTDCAQYLNGGFGGFDPDYYEKQHQARPTFFCNQINQTRDGFTVGFQTCSVILFSSNTPSYGYCSLGSYGDVFKQYQGAICKLFTTYLNAFKSNPKNVGFAFWTFKTGAGQRRIQQWDYAWAVDQGMIRDTINPTPVDQCDSIF